ncbi:hypothetical protein, partial [Escherichia coli]
DVWKYRGKSPISEKQKGKSVKFFTIAYNLLRNKQLPQPSK